MRALMVALVLILAGCGGSASVRPVAQVIAPADGARVPLGERITLQVSGAATGGIDRFEARLGGSTLATTSVPGAPRAASAALTLIAQPEGAITLDIIVVDRNGLSSDPIRLGLTVTGAAASAAAPATPSSGGACPYNSAFVSDVTIPDNTPIPANTPFTKTWRMRNSSACAWELGFTFAHVDRDRMGAPASVLVSPVAAGAPFDVSVSFVAPASPGIYTSTWQMRGPDGKLFGARAYAQIRVP